MENLSIIADNITANIALIPSSSISGSGKTDDSFYLSVFLIYVPGIVTNFISIILLLSELRKTKVKTNVLLLALCTTDFVAVCLSCFWHTSRRMGLSMTYELCAVKSFLHPIMPLLTGSISLLMAIDRFLAFCKPFFYRTNVSKKFWMLCVLLVIVFLSVICALPHLGFGSLWTPRYRRGKLSYTCSVFTYQENLTKKIFHISYTSLGFLIVLSIISFNSLVAAAVLRLRHRTIEAQKGRTNQQINRSTEIKFAAIVGLLASVFVICWLPYNEALSGSWDTMKLRLIHRRLSRVHGTL
ncbi:prostacyclin receptor-like [Mytilus californianus]|uniref:prostacyclin receptor-like n=1 Tax=Mytilus californianus TaxID=6549 RepID=UPI0022478A70|nr:prostacyclin receptor-like [Mytilus californianus]